MGGDFANCYAKFEGRAQRAKFREIPAGRDGRSNFRGEIPEIWMSNEKIGVTNKFGLCYDRTPSGTGTARRVAGVSGGDEWRGVGEAASRLSLRTRAHGTKPTDVCEISQKFREIWGGRCEIKKENSGPKKRNSHQGLAGRDHTVHRYLPIKKEFSTLHLFLQRVIFDQNFDQNFE